MTRHPPQRRLIATSCAPAARLQERRLEQRRRPPPLRPPRRLPWPLPRRLSPIATTPSSWIKTVFDEFVLNAVRHFARRAVAHLVLACVQQSGPRASVERVRERPRDSRPCY